jgi:glycosyltransferase involved in cell wall biosynthesis
MFLMERNKDSMLRIHIDGRMLYGSGIGRCLREIIKEVPSIDKNIEISLYGDPQDYKRYLSEYNIGGKEIIFREDRSSIYSIREQIVGSMISLKDKSSQIFYYPHYNLPFVPGRNSVFTIHDFTQFKFPEYFGKNKIKIARLVLNNAVKKAKKIIVVSKSTLYDFYYYFPEYKRKAEVIYNGVSEKFKILGDREKKDFLTKNKFGRYILFIGNNKPHKNISGLIKSFASIKKEFSDFKLVIISSGFDLESFPVDDRIKEDIFVVDETSDDELVYYYNCAFMFILPSFYEGFGLPVIEAMACGCPVITSNVSSLPEVGGDAALYINPYDTGSFTHGIRKLIGSSNLRNNLIEKGAERAKLFSWENTAGKYLEVFENII